MGVEGINLASTNDRVEHTGEMAKKTGSDAGNAPRNPKYSLFPPWPWLAEEIVRGLRRPTYRRRRPPPPDPTLPLMGSGEEQSEADAMHEDGNAIEDEVPDEDMDLDVEEADIDDEVDEEGRDYYKEMEENKGLTDDEIDEKHEMERLVYLAHQMQAYGWEGGIDVADIGAYVPSRNPKWIEYHKSRELMKSEREVERKEKEPVEMQTGVRVEEKEVPMQAAHPELESWIAEPIAAPASEVQEDHLFHTQNLDPDTDLFFSKPDKYTPLEEPTDNKKASPDFNRKFLTGALRALKKLRNASKDATTSPELRSFVEGLGNLRDIIKVGLQSLQSIFDNKAPSRLKDIYCLLHVAYAMSQVEKRPQDPDVPSKSFRQDLFVFRSCLSPVPEGPAEVHIPQDLFDEIVGVMWEEFDEGLQWVMPRLRKGGSGNLGLEQIAPQPDLAMELQTNQYWIPQTTSNRVTTPVAADYPTPSNIGGSNAIPEVEHIFQTTIFQDLVLTLSKICHQQFSYLYWSGAIDGLLFWTENLDLLDLILADNNANGCKYCGNPYIDSKMACIPCRYLMISLTGLQISAPFWFYNQVALAVVKITNLVARNGPKRLPSKFSNEELFQEPIEIDFDEGLGTRSEMFPHDLGYNFDLMDVTPDSLPVPEVAAIPTLQVQPAALIPPPPKPRTKKPNPKKYPCPHCNHKPFANRQSLDRHLGKKHDPNATHSTVTCGYQGCSAKRSITISATWGKRDDNMRTHMRTKHGFTNEQLNVWGREYTGDVNYWDFD
ncbi:hypothetical protein TWF718_004532 [Orbilia javanica]|uniref:C2H2-type domain-containing protein n=1 Tax=Orbilia javanica TaxID=47235 RepID=A0AAN8RF33_9PEZI